MTDATKGVTFELNTCELVSMLSTSCCDCEPNSFLLNCVVMMVAVLVMLTIVEVSVAVEDNFRANAIVAFADGYNAEALLTVDSNVDVLVAVIVV